MTKAQERAARASEEDAQALVDEQERQSRKSEERSVEDQARDDFYAEQDQYLQDGVDQDDLAADQDQAEAETKSENESEKKPNKEDQIQAYTDDLQSRKADIAQVEASEARSALVANRQEALRKADEFKVQHPTREELEESYAASDARQKNRDDAAKKK